MINTRNDLSRLSSAIDDARSALMSGDDAALRQHLYTARSLISQMQSQPTRPDFTVKATDPHAPAMVLYWISQACKGAVSKKKRKRAMEHYDRLVNWQKNHPEEVKIPD